MLLWLASAFAAPDAARLEAAWERWRAHLDSTAIYPFHLSAGEWATLARGEVTRRRDQLEGTDRVFGVVWVAADLDTTWLAIQDPHGEVIRGFSEELLPESTFHRKVAYQRIDLPWPLAPRQWVITVVNNLSLIRATDGQLWERTWTLSDRRGAAAEVANGVWLDVNEGGWFLCAAEGGTLVGYHARTVVGGVVPDEMATRWSYSTLVGMLEKVAARAAEMPAHYAAGHAPIRRADGTEIPTR